MYSKEMVKYGCAWVAEWYTRESQKLVVVETLRVRVSPQAQYLRGQSSKVL